MHFLDLPPLDMGAEALAHRGENFLSETVIEP
jgi:hypothetical protein